MASAETELLKKNLADQLDRVIRQLEDLEEHKKELSLEEYESMKEDTKRQLVEFSSTLSKFSSGCMTLVDEISAMKMAVQAAISEAFKTPEIIGLFARKQPAQLRLKLNELERDRKIGRLSDETLYNERKVEILLALKKLNDNLSENEAHFLQANNENMRHFEKAVTITSLDENFLRSMSKKSPG